MDKPAKLTFTPLYEQVKKEILARIIQGEWSPGSFLPSETALAEQYGVSQGTLRKALNALTREKRLVRYQGKGTAVSVMDEHSTLFRFFLFTDHNGKKVYPLSKVINVSHDEPDQTEINALRLNPGVNVIHIDRIRILNDEPVINERITLPMNRFPNFSLPISSIPNTLYEYYQLRFGITVARAIEEIEAIYANETDQSLLGVKEGSPLLLVSRIAYDLADEPVELRSSRIDTSRDVVYNNSLR